jgi:thiamine pyrophosphokinase
MKAVILANGKRPPVNLIRKHIKGAGLIIAVDGGIKPLRLFGVIPDVLIGDFDSLSEEDMQYASNQRVKRIQLAREKDNTDTQAAMDYAIENDADEIVMMGATGSRIDHTYANILLLVRALKKNVKASIIDKKNILFVSDGDVLLNGRPGDVVSILPLTEGTVAGDSYGLKYPLKDLALPIHQPIGASNEMTQPKAGVRIKRGLALIVLSKD